MYNKKIISQFMDYTIFLLFATVFLLPLVMIFLGLIWRKNGPKTINSVYGYRTKRSMASQEAWNFAHIYSGKIFLSVGLIQLVLTLLLCIYWGGYYKPADSDFIGQATIAVLSIQTLVFIVIIPIVEFELKKRFS